MEDWGSSNTTPNEPNPNGDFEVKGRGCRGKGKRRGEETRVGKEG